MNPHVLRLKSPRRQGGPPIYKALSLVDDRFVASIHGGELQVRDLAQKTDPRPMLELENCHNHAFVTKTLVTYDDTHGFRRFVLDGERFVEASRFVLAETPAPWPTHLVLSPSGRFLCVEWPPAADEKTCRVALIDTIRGEIIAVHPRALSARASFTLLHGTEVLFLSAPGYMDVLLLDAATGRTLQCFESTTGWDFCHTNYELSADGERLLAFGCVWAAPYEVRLYDASPWTRGSSPLQEGFPLPLLYSQNEDLQYEIILPSRFVPTSDGLLDVLSLVDLRSVQKLGPDDLRDLEEDLSPMNFAALEAARGTDAEKALLQRRVHRHTGEIDSFRISPICKTGETHVHLLPEHQALLIGDGVQWFDGEHVHGVAPFEKPKGWYETAVASDGSLIVVRELVDP